MKNNTYSLKDFGLDKYSASDSCKLDVFKDNLINILRGKPGFTGVSLYDVSAGCIQVNFYHDGIKGYSAYFLRLSVDLSNMADIENNCADIWDNFIQCDLENTIDTIRSINSWGSN